MGSGAARFTMTDDGVAPGLWLIGLGPGDLDHITERARRVARGCSKRYLEGYTAVLPPSEYEIVCRLLHRMSLLVVFLKLNQYYHWLREMHFG